MTFHMIGLASCTFSLTVNVVWLAKARHGVRRPGLVATPWRIYMATLSALYATGFALTVSRAMTIDQWQQIFVWLSPFQWAAWWLPAFLDRRVIWRKKVGS